MQTNTYPDKQAMTIIIPDSDGHHIPRLAIRLLLIKTQYMKKIVAVFDGLRFSNSTLQHAVALSRKHGAHLEGLFLDDFTYNSFNMYELIRTGATKKQIAALEAQDKNKRDQAARSFEMACRQAGLTYCVHHDRNIAIQDVLHESIYADLLVIDKHETFVRTETNPPTRFIRDLLADVQCPVFLTPGEYHEPGNVVLLYDGDPSSVYAIKMASYLFTWLMTLPTEVVSINEPHTGLHLDDGRLMKEFMKRHAPKAAYKVMQGQPEDKITSWLRQQSPNTLVVLGAYRRSAVSRWFHASMADVLMSEIQLPLFIAHNK